MERNNYQTLITVPATDCNFTAALGYASAKELFAAFRYLERHPLHNKTRLKAVSREVKRRDRKGGCIDAVKSNKNPPV